MKNLSLFILCSIISFNVFAKANIPKHFDHNNQTIRDILQKKGFSAAVEHSLDADCKKGKNLSCAVLKYRKKPSKKNVKRISKILKKYPCRVSSINNCTQHLFARIYMGKHKKALKLARKMCAHQHEYSCRQIVYYRAMGEFEESLSY